MRFTLPVLAGLASLAAAVSVPTFGSCINDCLMSNPVSSQCDGDETGAALNKCVCSSLRGSDLVGCINKCPSDDQGSYLDAVVPDNCAGLFPDASKKSGSDDNNDDSDDSSGDNSDSKDDDKDDSKDDDSDSKDDSNDGDDEDAAVGISAPIMMVAGGLVAALIL
ncbi:hypothetical protein N3K66_008657 [Trichothecium roseum]|uniref:Uncharacterized protein n=1 Tax=Trichothecium roseum TaxID=47278 RepID=A0ACC0UR01_9HYPO|nr:hypothetical protein N3K66_008657 [Trichothecium roseum]